MNKNNKKDGMKENTKASKSCSKRTCKDKAQTDVITNDTSWYLKDGTPHFSGEFDDLQKIGVVNKVLPNGIALDSAVTYMTALAPPVDAQNSFYKQCATLLSKVRKKNTGTNIYTTEVVLVYIWKMLIATTLAAQLAKEIKAVSHVMPGNADSPWATLNVINSYRDWEYEAAHLADTKNKADIVFKMVDALPMPKMAALDRNMMLFSNVFADSRGGKPSFANFRPEYIADLEIAEDKASIKFVARYGSSFGSHIEDTLDTITDIVASIYDDTNANFTMLRGDMLKYWQPRPVCLSMLYSPLHLSPMSAELASQLENASILGRGAGIKEGDFSVTINQTGTTLHLPLAGMLDPTIDSKAELSEQLINSRGGVPAEGELMAITALMPIAHHENAAASSYWNITAHNGLIVYDAAVLLSTGRNIAAPPATVELGANLIDVHSSVQSTMRDAFVTLQWMSSIMAHSPMLITDASSPRGYIWDVDFVGVISAQSLSTAITRVVRSLFQVALPETDRH